MDLGFRGDGALQVNYRRPSIVRLPTPFLLGLIRLNGIEPLLPDLGQVTNRRHATRPQHVSVHPVG